MKYTRDIGHHVTLSNGKQLSNMAEARQHPNDGIFGEKGSGDKEARVSSFEAIPAVRSSLSSSPTPNADGLLVLDEGNAYKHTAYNFSTRKKWAVLTVVALCQTSMSKFT